MLVKVIFRNYLRLILSLSRQGQPRLSLQAWFACVQAGRSRQPVQGQGRAWFPSSARVYLPLMLKPKRNAELTLPAIKKGGRLDGILPRPRLHAAGPEGSRVVKLECLFVLQWTFYSTSITFKFRASHCHTLTGTGERAHPLGPCGLVQRRTLNTLSQE